MIWLVVEEAVDDSNGWDFLLQGQTVVQLGVDYRFWLRLEGGAEIVIETPFLLRCECSSVRVDPEVVTEHVGVLALLHQRVRTAAASRSGLLRLAFHDGHELEVAPSDEFENWQVTLPDGRLYVGLPGGDVASFPAPA
ncbi:MAG: hypothetical protein H0U22_07095 [Geodermatophilaceae bacterium]|nr:hypothetical protein [Geodermatophilaceae bacterium]